MNVSKKIYELRERFKLTQKELATAVNVSHSYIAQLESGASMLSLEMAFKIEHFLKLPAGELSKPVLDEIYQKATKEPLPAGIMPQKAPEGPRQAPTVTESVIKTEGGVIREITLTLKIS